MFLKQIDMENELNDTLNGFLSDDEKETKTTSDSNVSITERTGLIERIDRQVVTPDGRTLLNG